MQDFLAAFVLPAFSGFSSKYAAPFVSPDFAAYIRMEPVFYGAVILAGVALGLLGSVILLSGSSGSLMQHSLHCRL